MKTGKKKSFTDATYEELRRIAGTRSLLLVSVVIPPVLFFFFAFLYQSALVRGIPAVVIDGDNSATSRMVVTWFAASPSFTFLDAPSTINEGKEMLLKGETDVVVYLPPGMERDIKKGKQVHPLVFANGLNVIKSNYIMNDVTKIFKTVSGGVLLKKFRSGGMSEQSAMDAINPVRYDIQTLYNSNYSYLDFLVPALCVFTIFMSSALAGATVFNFREDDRESGEYPVKIFTARLIPHAVVGILNAGVLVALIYPLFGITLRGSAFGLFIFISLFSLSSLLLGMVVSSVIRSRMLAAQVILFFTTPAFVFSGLTYPIWAMPGLHRVFAQVIPYTHFLEGFIRIYLMGDPVSGVGYSLNLLVAGILIPSGLVIAVNRFRFFLSEKRSVK